VVDEETRISATKGVGGNGTAVKTAFTDAADGGLELYPTGVIPLSNGMRWEEGDERCLALRMPLSIAFRPSALDGPELSFGLGRRERRNGQGEDGNGDLAKFIYGWLLLGKESSRPFYPFRTNFFFGDWSEYEKKSLVLLPFLMIVLCVCFFSLSFSCLVDSLVITFLPIAYILL
jgi:hypothetical protein